MNRMKNLLVSMSLSIALVTVVLLRLALKPLRLLDKGLRMSGQWMLKEWRA